MSAVMLGIGACLMTTRTALLPDCTCIVQLASDRVRGLGQSGGLALHGRAAALVMKLLSPRLPCAAGTFVTVEHEQSTDYVLVVASADTERFSPVQAKTSTYACLTVALSSPDKGERVTKLGWHLGVVRHTRLRLG